MDAGHGPERNLLELLSAADVSPLSVVSAELARIRITAVSADSRQVRPGTCFVAVPGTRFDGRAFIDEAVRRGAAAIVGEEPGASPPGVGTVRVVDAQTALARLSAAYFGFAPGQPHSRMRLVGVTGTNGKSTTCVLLQSILSVSGRPTALLGKIRYDLVGEVCPAPWTTPPAPELYAYLHRAAKRGATHAVMEVSSHSLAQARCRGHRFACGVFTNLSGDHLDYHRTLHAYAQAKKRLFDDLHEQAWAVVNAGDPMSAYMLRDCAAVSLTFGLNAEAGVSGAITHEGIDGSRFVLRLPSVSTEVRLSLAGRHGVSNALAAAATAFALGIEPEHIRQGLEAVNNVPGRLQRVDTADRGFTLFVDYAHTDDALISVLATLRPLTPGRLICVFGCGGDRDRTKRPRMAEAVGQGADLAIVTSDNPRTEDPMAIIRDICAGFTSQQRRRVEIEADRRTAIERAVALAREGDTLLIAGKGHEDYQIIGRTKRHFDDVEVATQCLHAQEQART